MAKKVVDTTATSAGRASVKPNSQTGGNGNATTNVYNNAFQTYRTNLGKVKDAQIGQLNTEYNNQQRQIEGAYQNLNRNAYVSYMQRNLQNRQSASNMGVNRNGMGENMNTANAVDYNRSVGNLGAYRVGQLSNAQNQYNSNVATVENQYANDLNQMQQHYRDLNIARQNELADLQSQQRFQASESAKDRRQSAREAQQSLNATRQQNRFQVFADTISGYRTVKSVDKAIKNLKAAKKNGTLSGWQKEYYSDMLSYLRAQRNVVKQKGKK